MAGTEQTPADVMLLRQRYQQKRLPAPESGRRQRCQNVGSNERIVSGAAGAILAGLGLARRDLPGLLIAGVGGMLLARGATGRCQMYQALGINTTEEQPQKPRGVHVTQTFLVGKSPDQLYAFWRNFENLPSIMDHLKSVRVIDEQRSHWVAKAPRIAGGEVEWDAEIVGDEPGKHLSWRSLPGATVEHRGIVEFTPALGDRGTAVKVVLDYQPPAGQLGRWVAKLFGEEPEQQIRDDLRNFKRMMEVGEVLTTSGQPRGNCLSHGGRRAK